MEDCILPTPVGSADGKFKLTRLNSDTSWLVEAGGVRLALDPWLVAEEVDYFRWFNTQVHSEPTASVDAILPVDAIVVGLPFSDHCHEKTLDLFPADIPIYGANGAAKRIRAHFGKARKVIDIPSFWKQSPSAPQAACGGVRFAAFPAPGGLDITHCALVMTIADESGCLLYAPHGLKATAKQTKAIEACGSPVTVVATSTTYAMPIVLGGTVNLGLDAASKLVRALKAERFIDTHSERKPATGFVRRVAKTTYVTPEAVHDLIPVALQATAP